MIGRLKSILNGSTLSSNREMTSSSEPQDPLSAYYVVTPQEEGGEGQ